MRDEEFARIAAFLAGEGSVEERAITERWIADDPGRQEVLKEFQTAWLHAGRVDPKLEVHLVWQQLQRRYRARSAQPPTERVRAVPRSASASKHGAVLTLTRRPSWNRRSSLWMQAAALLVVAGASGLIGRFAIRSQTNNGQPAMRLVATGRGQRAMLTLGDGSRVVLGVDSRLRFAEGFGRARRDVYLEGDALFEVEHDVARPFVVHTAKALTTDLGTVFAVRDYKADKKVTIAVRTGKVAMQPLATRAGRREHNVIPSAPILLGPGQSATLTSDGQISSRNTQVESYFAWTEGRLVFENTPLSDVAVTLERWYDVQIQLSPLVARRTVNASFDDDGVETVLKLIGRATDVRVTRLGKTFRLDPVSTRR